MGSIYLAGTVHMPGFDCGGSADISFGDTVLDKELRWIKLKNELLVADRCVCTNISWEQLDEKGLVLGTLITINGETYWCRCLRVGAKEGEPNEWDSVLDEAGEDNDLWHWDNVYFWGQETPEYEASNRVVRGYYSARYWGDDGGAAYRGVYVGFRPALEYLGSEPYTPDTLLGKKARVYGLGGVTIEGCLVDFSDYDVILEANPSTYVNCPWITKEGRNIIVERKNIIWLKEG